MCIRDSLYESIDRLLVKVSEDLDVLLGIIIAYVQPELDVYKRQVKLLAFLKAYIIFFRRNGVFLQIFLYFCAPVSYTHLARRYLFSKKSTHVINVISSISVIGVAVATMALAVSYTHLDNACNPK